MSNEKEADKNQEAPFALNQKNIKNDMLHFKDDILKDMKTMQKNIAEKFEISNNVLKEKLEAYDRKLNLYNERIVQLTNLVVTDKDLKEKVEKLLQGKIELKDHILTNEIKLSNLEKNFQDRVGKIEYILSDSVVYPSVVGQKGKFKTFHEFIDYVIFQLNQNIVYREKNQLDVSTYKNKLENATLSLKMQLDNIIKNTNEFTTKSVNELEEKVKGMLSLFDERLKDVRVQNLNYIKNLEQFYNNLKEDFKRLVNMKNNLYNKFNSEVYNMKRDNLQVVKLFGNYKKEFNLMKDRLTKLSEFIKDVRFRINVGQEIKRMEFYNMANHIDFTKNQKLDDHVSSGLKKYINGEINADQLATYNTRRGTKSSIGVFGNVSNLNNHLNLDEDLNNEDSLAGINNYLMKNKNFFDLDNNDNNTPSNKSKFRNTIVPDFGVGGNRRKSVNSMVNSLSTNNLINKQNRVNNQNDNNNQNNQNNFYKTVNQPSNNEFQELSYRNSIKSIQRLAQSSEVKGRKRYQSVFNSENPFNFQNIQNYQPIEKQNRRSVSNQNPSVNNNLINDKNSNIDPNLNPNFITNVNINLNSNLNNNIESSDSKISNGPINIKANYNNRNIIKEEEEYSKKSESESSISEEQKKNNNKNNNTNINNNSNKINKDNKINNNEKANINSNKNSENITPIKSNKNFINDYNNKGNILSHNNNINLYTLKETKNLKEIKEKKQLENIISHKKLNEKKASNNIVIDCNKTQTIINVPYIIENQIIHNNNNNNNSARKPDNNNYNKIKNEVYASKKNIDEKNKNNQINGFSQTKTSNIQKEDKTKFSHTSINFTKRNENNNFMDPYNNNQDNNTIDSGDYKSFKGKKYNFLNQAFVAKIKENLVPTESQTVTNNRKKNNQNKKNIIKIKNYKNNNYNGNNNGIEFGKDEGGPKHYRNISMDNKKSDAQLIQKMVNNLQSYLSNYTSGVEKDMYKNKQNFIFKENSNSFYGGKINNNYANSNNKNKENVIQLKLKYNF